MQPSALSYLWSPANGKKMEERRRLFRSEWKSELGSSRVAGKCARSKYYIDQYAIYCYVCGIPLISTLYLAFHVCEPFVHLMCNIIFTKDKLWLQQAWKASQHPWQRLFKYALKSSQQPGQRLLKYVIPNYVYERGPVFL